MNKAEIIERLKVIFVDRIEAEEDIVLAEPTILWLVVVQFIFAISSNSFLTRDITTLA